MNLYVFKPPTSIKAENALMLNTVDEDKTFYIQRQFERAKLVTYIMLWAAAHHRLTV